MKTLRMMAGEIEELKGMDNDPRFQTQSDRMANREALDDALSRGFSSKSREEWIALLELWDVPGGPVNDIAEALADPQVQMRNMVVEVDHPTAGRYRTAGNPIKTGAPEEFNPPPTLGQDTSSVLTGLLGYSGGEVEALRQMGAI